MLLSLLALYIIVILIRPMDWLDTFYGWPLVNNLAMLLIPVSFFGSAKEDFASWWKLPEVKIAAFLLFAASMSNFFVWLQAVVDTFQRFGKVILCYGIILLVVRREKNFRIILWTILMCVAWMAVHGILQIQRGYGFGYLPPLWRASHNVFQITAFGIFEDPNDLCLVFILALPLLYSEFRASNNGLTKTLALFMMPLIITGIWLTNSRGGIMGLFGMVTGYSILKTKGIKRWFTILIPAVIIFIFAPSRFAGKEVDLGRATLWGYGLRSFQRHPIFGIGHGNFQDTVGEGFVAHNSFIHVLTELGLFGYLPWFLLIFMTMTHLCRAINLSSSISRDDQFHLVGLFAALSGYLTAAYFLSRSYDYVLYILLALALAKVSIVANNSSLYDKIFDKNRDGLKRGIIIGLASVLVMWVTVRLANMMGGRS